MRAKIDIIAQLYGAERVQRDMVAMTNSATAMQQRINSTTGIGGGSGYTPMSAEAAGRQIQAKLEAGIAGNTEQRLARMASGFKIAAAESNGFGSAMARLDPRMAIVASRLTGIDPMLLRIGFRFGVFGAAAAAGLAVLNSSIESVRSNLKELELQDPGKLGTLANIYGLGGGWQTDMEARKARQSSRAEGIAAMTREQFAAPDWEKEFEKFTKPLVEVGIISAATYRQWYEAAKKAVDEETNLAEKRKAWAESSRDEAAKQARLQEDLTTAQANNRWAGLSAEEKRADLVKEIADNEKFIAEFGKTAALPTMIENERKKGQLAEIDRGIAAKNAAQAAENRREAIAPWLSEMKKPAGFAATTLTNSLEGSQSVALASSAKERQEATQRAMQQQIALLEAIKTNTGKNAGGTETWSN